MNAIHRQDRTLLRIYPCAYIYPDDSKYKASHKSFHKQKYSHVLLKKEYGFGVLCLGWGVFGVREESSWDVVDVLLWGNIKNGRFRRKVHDTEVGHKPTSTKNTA